MSSSESRRSTAGSIGVKYLATDDLVPNPHNPRMLFDRTPLQILEESIKRVGILVPLTVYWDKNRNHYVILDGQRRWICAKKIGLRKVPVNQVAEPSLVQNIVTMFQIHKLREDWELMPTALKLQVLMHELGERNDKKLASLCGLDQAVVARCKKLLSYPKGYQDLMLHPDPAKRVKADFFIELYAVTNDRTVKKMGWYSKENFTKRMLAKYQGNKGIKAVTDFRIMKQHINNARKVGRIDLVTKKLKEFVDNDELPLDHIQILGADVKASAQKLMNDIKRIEDSISNIDPDYYYGEERLWSSLERLLLLIQSKLRAAGRRSAY